MARQKGGAGHGPFQQRAVGGSEGHGRVSRGGWRSGKHGGVGSSLLLLVVLLLLLHHGDGCGVVDGGCDEVLLGHRGHAGHGVILRQRAFVSTLHRLVFNLAAAVHSLCGKTGKDAIRRANKPRRARQEAGGGRESPRLTRKPKAKLRCDAAAMRERSEKSLRVRRSTEIWLLQLFSF